MKQRAILGCEANADGAVELKSAVLELLAECISEELLDAAPNNGHGGETTTKFCDLNDFGFQRERREIIAVTIVEIFGGYTETPEAIETNHASEDGLHQLREESINDDPFRYPE
jgi:hypothetical protein